MPIGSGLSAQVGFAAEAYTNEVQTISGTASVPFTLVFEGAATAPIAVNAAAAAVQAALEALPNIGSGGVVCAGGALPTAVTVTFSGPLVAGRNVAPLTVGNGATGLTIAQTTPGAGYGDPVTVTRFLEFNSESMELQEEPVESAGMRPGNTVLRSDRFAVNRKGATGGIEFEVVDRGFGLPIAHAMGAPAVITTPVGGTNSRLHTHTLGDAWNRSLTYQKGVPDITGSASNVRAFTYPGTKITQAEFSCEVDGFLMLALELDSYDERTDIALAAASYATGATPFHFGQAQARVGGALVDARSFRLTIPRPLATERYFMRGDTRKKQPILNAMAEITGELVMEFESLAMANRYNAATPAGRIAPFQIDFTGPILEAAIPATFGLLCPACRWEPASPTIEGPDLVTVTYTFRVLNDGTNQPVTCTYQTLDLAS